MRKAFTTFYKLTINGEIAGVYDTEDAAIQEYKECVRHDDSATYEIESFEGIWKLINILASLEDPEDDMWMYNTIRQIPVAVLKQQEFVEALLSREINTNTHKHLS